MNFVPKLPVLADERTKSLVFKFSDPFMVRDMIPQSKTLDHPNFNVAVKWTDATAQILRNMGYEAPFRPTRWPGMYQPQPHQLEMINHHLTHFRNFNLSEMGTMKTAPALWAADKLMNQGTIKKCLIITPLSTVERVWSQNIFDVVTHRTSVIVHGTEDHRRDMMKADVDFYILNHDATKIGWLRKHLKKRKDIGLIIVDEGGMFRNHDTEKYEGLVELIRPDQRVWWLTGTPCPNFPTDAWSQCRIINPRGVPQHFGAWKRMTMYQQSQFKWAKRAGAEDLVFNAMQPSIRFLKKDVLKNLPPVTSISLTCGLTPAQKNAYAAMKAEMTADIGNVNITAVHAADQITKLRQILLGSIKDKNTNSYFTLGFGPRLQVLRDAIDAASAKAGVIVPFKGIILALEKALTTGKNPVSVGVLNGDVLFSRRNKIISAFKSGAHPRVLLCHPKVMAHGLNLTEADTTIFFGPIYSNDEFEQVIERMNRAPQTRKMTIVRIGAHPLEWGIYKLIDERRLNQATILDLYRQTIT